MMKKNRILALLLALAMLFALAACGESKKPSVVGLWEAEVDMRQMMIDEMDKSVGGSISFADYLDSFLWDLTLELAEDGHYTLNYDITRSVEPFKSAVVSYMRDVINSQVGYEVSDDVIAQALGMPLEDYAQTVVDQMISTASTETGGYQDKNGCLIWDNGEQSPYTLTQDTLSFSVKTLGDLSFHRAG